MLRISQAENSRRQGTPTCPLPSFLPSCLCAFFPSFIPTVPSYPRAEQLQKVVQSGFAKVDSKLANVNRSGNYCCALVNVM
jgi:hypothetical protein